MARESEALPLGYEKLTERSYAAIVGNSGKIIAAITAIVAVLVTFTDISFSSLLGVEFTSTLAVTLIASYLIYFSLEDAGERLGEGSVEYVSAEKRYNAARSKIEPRHLKALREYCVRYSRDELNFRRSTYLCSAGYTAEDYEGYLDGESFSRDALRVFRRTRKMRPAVLTPSLLLIRDRYDRSSELESPDQLKLKDAALRLIPSTLCMLFTASVILTAKPDLSAAVVIEGILKLSALPVVGFRGYVSGYKYAKSAKSGWLEVKARILEGFLSEHGS